MLFRSAGGVRSDIVVPCKIKPLSGSSIRVSVSGLMGGHSGANINSGRANANKLMGRLLSALYQTQQIALISLAGGSKDNAITRETEAVIAVPSVAMASMNLLALADEIAGELVPEDRDCRIACERLTESEAASITGVMDEASTARVLGLLANAPCGVLAMSREVDGLVEYSRNLGILRTTQEGVRITFTSRASRESRLDGTVSALNALAGALGATVRHHSRYPGWEYAPVSAVRDAYTAAFETVLGGEMDVVAIHAGLECGYIKKQVPDMDIISIGPDMKGIHSPDEVLYLDSVERVWKVVARMITDWCVEG